LEDFYQACIAVIYELLLPAVIALSLAGVLVALLQSIFQIQDQSLGMSLKIFLCVVGAVVFGASALQMLFELWEFGLRTIARVS